MGIASPATGATWRRPKSSSAGRFIRSEDIGRHNLLDIERRWFYVMFLQSLGRYLEYKSELGELDVMYSYGRACLLRYAEWMAEHETPYLDRREELEFPTETWAAQDMRKSDVFALRRCTRQPSRGPGSSRRRILL